MQNNQRSSLDDIGQANLVLPALAVRSVGANGLERDVTHGRDPHPVYK